jgi:CheY-like chemotaxis protein
MTRAMRASVMTDSDSAIRIAPAVEQTGGWMAGISAPVVGLSAPPLQVPPNGVATRIARIVTVCDDDGMSLTVLIVDDHPGFRARARALLESEGFVVVAEADDGASGVRSAAECSPDLVLLDVQLPDMDGFEVAAEIAAADGDVQIVLVSSRDGSDFGALVTKSGARGFIPKAELSGAGLTALLR